MKYTIKPSEQDAFKPFQIVIDVETREEAVLFHNMVAVKIANSSEFIGDVYRAISHPVKEPKSGSVPLKDRT